jgi:2-methylaconitate cis-trans-isomerase PrpF
VTGRLLPTGRPRDRLDVPALGRSLDVSIVDVANLCVFVAATDVGMTGTEGPANFSAAQLGALVAVKAAAAGCMNLAGDGLVPLPVAVAAPLAYETFAGRRVEADEVDLLARLAGGRPPMLHKTFPGTAATCTAVAARIPGTVAAAALRAAASGAEIRIGHPGGVMPARAVVSDGPAWTVRQAGYFRTARRLLEGRALLRRAVAEGLSAGTTERPAHHEPGASEGGNGPRNRVAASRANARSRRGAP